MNASFGEIAFGGELLSSVDVGVVRTLEDLLHLVELI